MRPSLAVFAAVALASSANAAAQSSAAPGASGFDQNYVSFRGGLHLPQGDAVDQLPGYSFNTGFGGEIAIGRRFSPNLAGEVGLGYLSLATDDIDTGYQTCDLYGCSEIMEKGELHATPFTATLKAFLPLEGFDLYALGGFGLYFVSGKDTYSAQGFGSDSQTASASPLGLHIGAGAMIPLASKWKLSLDARYVAVKAKLSFDGYSYDVNLGGMQLSGGLQYAF